MIVKNVAEAVRRQDWVAVAIEFLLVVLGVLLAFQINEWATEREARAERDAATERLLGEAEQVVAYMRLGFSGQQQVVDDIDFGLRRIQSGLWRPADEERMTVGLARLRATAPLSPPSSVYDDLVASGAFGKIGDARMRSAIARYRATVDFAARAIEELRVEMPSLEAHPAFRFVYSEGGPRRARLEVDYTALRHDPLLQEKMAIYADNQRKRMIIAGRTLKDAEHMCIEVGRFVRRPCNLRLPPPKFD